MPAGSQPITRGEVTGEEAATPESTTRTEIHGYCKTRPVPETWYSNVIGALYKRLYYLTALKGGVLNPSTRINLQIT